MQRLKLIKEEDATGEVKEIYASVKSTMGMIPNLFKGFANSPVTLKAYLTLDKLISESQLSEIEREIVRLVVSQYNGCDYCLAAHTMVGKMKGLNEDQIIDIRQGKSDDLKYSALISFTLQVLETKGFVDDKDIDAFRNAGYTDENIVEVVTIIAQKTLSNYFNHINNTEIDFPKAPDINSI